MSDLPPCPFCEGTLVRAGSTEHGDAYRCSSCARPLVLLRDGHPWSKASNDYSGLAPQFRPGGGSDPAWMRMIRPMLAKAKTVDVDFVRKLFDYYDAARDMLEIERKLNGSHND